MKIAIVTDSNSGVTQAQAKELGITVIPMPFMINGETYEEDINLTQEQFYTHLTDGAEISTSQPSPQTVMNQWNELLKEYDQIVHIPMSSGLSGSCQTAMMLADEDEYEGKVFVVNNQRISVTQRQSAIDAKAMADKGMDGEEIKRVLEETKLESSIYITVDTLKYLKKGGRITPAAAAIGTMLKLNPVLQIQGEKLDAFAKARGKASAKKIMLKAMQDDLDTRFAEFAKDGKMHMEVAYSGNPEEAEEWAALVKETFPQFDFHMDPLSLSVACHIGQGALAIAMTCYIPEDDTK